MREKYKYAGYYIKGIEKMNSQTIRSSESLKRINNEISKLIENGDVPEDIGVAMNPVECLVAEPSFHGLQMLKERGIELNDVQSYVDNAVIMFEQEGDRDDILHLYLSFDGGCVLINTSGKIVTAYSRDNFKPHIRKILKVVNRHGK